MARKAEYKVISGSGIEVEKALNNLNMEHAGGGNYTWRPILVTSVLTLMGAHLYVITEHELGT